MRHFSDQCLDMACSILGHHIGFLRDDGTLEPALGEHTRADEPGHVAFAIGEFCRAAHVLELEGCDLVDSAARVITLQAFSDEDAAGVGHALLGLLTFGPSLDRNPVWERLVDETRKRLTEYCRSRKAHNGYEHVYAVARSVARFSLDLSKKDDTGKLIDTFLETIAQGSSGGFFDTADYGKSGLYELEGVQAFVFLRQVLQLHVQSGLRERKLPSLRTFVDRYLRIIPDLVRSDGLGWTFGRNTGIYGQMTLISLLLQALSDGWIAPDKVSTYYDCLKRLFRYFFTTYWDAEHGRLVVRDDERDIDVQITSRLANFDAVRSLSQWARLAHNLPVSAQLPLPSQAKIRGRYVVFNKNNQGEQGVFLYQDIQSGLSVQLPLLSGAGSGTCGPQAFPHCPGLFDWPVSHYEPILLPELQFGPHRVVPSFYGKSCVAGLNGPGCFYFRYQQPDLIDYEEKIVPGLGSCKVDWTFEGGHIRCVFSFSVKQPVQLDGMRYVLAVAAPHSLLHNPASLTQGPEGLGVTVIKDDFQAEWAQPRIVTDDPEYRTYTGKIHYLQVLERKHPLQMRPGREYRLELELRPDIRTIEEHGL